MRLRTPRLLLRDFRLSDLAALHPLRQEGFIETSCDILGFRARSPLIRPSLASQSWPRISSRNKGRIVLIHVDGPMSFGSAKNMVRRLEGTPDLKTFNSVVLDLSDVTHFDGTAALAVEDMLRIVQGHGQHLFFVGMHPTVANVLEGMGVLHLIRPGHRHGLRLDALHHAAHIAGSIHPADVPSPGGA